MALNDVTIRNVKPNGRAFKLKDSDGLFLDVRPSGKKIWRVRYWIKQKENTLTLGEYPAISLKDARVMRDEARKLIVVGIRPESPKQANSSAQEQPQNTFANIAQEWLEQRRREQRSEKTLSGVESRLRRLVLPFIGNLEMDQIQAPALLQVIKRIEAKGTLETAHRVLNICGQIFRYAIVTGRAVRDPSSDLKGALLSVKSKHFSTITTPKEIGPLLKACEGYQGSEVVRIGLLVSALTFVRPGELRQMEWSEVDLDASEWRIPKEKMKMRRPHIVPLSTQTVELLRQLFKITGHGRYAFPSYRTPAGNRPMSDNTLNAALRRLGYGKEEMTAHGFRAMASTILYENGWPGDVIERQLAHMEKNAIKAAYNHAEHLDKRRQMMQWLADYLDGLKDNSYKR
jgi:integrase